MYHVLLALDESEARAQAQVAAIERLPHANEAVAVDVLYVEEDDAGADAEWAAGGFSEAYAAEMANLDQDRGRPDSVDVALEDLEAAGIDATVHVASGSPAGAILAAAEEFDSDSIVLGTQGHTPVGKVLFGSVTQAVILDSDRPVTVVPTA